MGKSSDGLAKEKPGSIIERHWFWTLKRLGFESCLPLGKLLDLFCVSVLLICGNFTSEIK